MWNPELDNMLAARGEPTFRRQQAERAIFKSLISDWEQASDLPAALRTALNAQAPVVSLTEIGRSQSKRGDSIKCLLSSPDGQRIETVLLQHEDGRNTVCVSSQAGCPMRCAFCATGQQGLQRNLTSREIVEQVLHFARQLQTQNQRVSNVVFMGMGEPFHNYDQVLTAARQLNSTDGLGIAARKISISTCGLVPGIRRLTDEPEQFNLAISLHAPTDECRSRLMPVNDAYPIATVMAEIERYTARTNRQVMFEYLLIDQVNDTQKQADQLAELLGHNPLYHVNLIRYHRTGEFIPSPQERRDAFYDRLKKRGLSVTHRVSFGEDIKAACGMLAGK